MADCTKTISTALESRPNRFIGTDVVSKKTCSNCCVDDFYSSVKVWIERPQVVNKRLMGAILEDCREEEEGHSGDWVHMKRKLLPKQSDVRPGTEHVTVTDCKDIHWSFTHHAICININTFLYPSSVNIIPHT